VSAREHDALRAANPPRAAESADTPCTATRASAIVTAGAVDTNLWERVLDQFGREKLLVRIFALIVDRMRKDFIWRTEDGALTQLFLAADSAAISTRNLRGRYFHPQALEVAPCKKHATNLTLQRELWAFSERLVADALAK